MSPHAIALLEKGDSEHDATGRGGARGRGALCGCGCERDWVGSKISELQGRSSVRQGLWRGVWEVNPSCRRLLRE